MRWGEFCISADDCGEPLAIKADLAIISRLNFTAEIPVHPELDWNFVLKIGGQDG